MRIVFFVLGLSWIGCGPKSTPAQPDMALATVDLNMAPAPDDLAVAPDGCSTLQQDCPGPNQKCNFVIVKQEYTEACVDLIGNKGLSEACMRTAPGDEGDGHDNCQKGFYCSDYGTYRPLSPERHCRKFCSKNSDCAPKQACFDITETVGLCAPTCTPFGSDCAGDLNCSDWAGDVNSKVTYLCRQPGLGKPGEECPDDGCIQDAICLLEGNGMSYCYKLCNAQHPCPRGTTCKAVLGDANNGTACQK